MVQGGVSLKRASQVMVLSKRLNFDPCPWRVSPLFGGLKKTAVATRKR